MSNYKSKYRTKLSYSSWITKMSLKIDREKCHFYVSVIRHENDMEMFLTSNHKIMTQIDTCLHTWNICYC